MKIYLIFAKSVYLEFAFPTKYEDMIQNLTLKFIYFYTVFYMFKMDLSA